TGAGAVEAALAPLGQPVATLRAVGPKRAAELARFGLATVEDILWHLPFRYEDWRTRVPLSALRPGEDVTAVGEVVGVHHGFSGRRGRRLLEVVLRDGAASAVLVWFNQVQYFATRFRTGQRLLVHGRVEAGIGRGPHRLVHPRGAGLGPAEQPPRPPAPGPPLREPPRLPAGAHRRARPE